MPKSKKDTAQEPFRVGEEMNLPPVWKGEKNNQLLFLKREVGFLFYYAKNRLS